MTVAALCENQVNLKIDRRNVSIRIQNNGNVYIYIAHLKQFVVFIKAMSFRMVRLIKGDKRH